VVEGPPTNGIGIFGLPLTSTQQGLEQLLSPFPGIIAIKMVHNRAAVNGRGGEFKGYAFVYFDTVDNASRARSQISGMVIDGCTIDAKYSNRSLE
jgi:transformer-2 protein